MKGSYKWSSEHGQYVVFAESRLPMRRGYIGQVEGFEVARVSDDDIEITQVCQCCEAKKDIECFTSTSVTVSPQVSSEWQCGPDNHRQ